MIDKSSEAGTIDLSIIIPVYNTEPYITQCLESVLSQTKREIEVICVDDCSTDNSRRILEDFAHKDTRVVVIGNETNLGAAVSRNQAIKKANGKYIGFVDSDDSVDPTYFEELWKLAIQSGADVVGTWMLDHYADGNCCAGWWRIKKSYDRLEYVSQEEKLGLLYRNCNTSPCTHLYYKEFIINKGITFAEGMTGEDQYFNFLAFYFANKICFLPEGGAYYHYYTSRGISGNPKLEDPSYEKKILDQNLVCDLILKFAENYGLSAKAYVNLLNDLVEISRGRLHTLEGAIQRRYFNDFRRVLLSHDVPEELVENIWLFPIKIFEKPYSSWDYWRFLILSKILIGKPRREYKEKKKRATTYLKSEPQMIHYIRLDDKI
jgi:glycosyltransferase involved in cell wall biosynthesis